MSDDACSDSPNPRHRILKRVLVAVAIVLVACVGGFLLWASDYYHADATAVAVEQQDSTIEYEDDQVIRPACVRPRRSSSIPGPRSRPRPTCPSSS